MDDCTRMGLFSASNFTCRSHNRRQTINEASKGFTALFVAVLHNPETAAAPAGHAVIVQGADLTSEMLLGPLRIIQKVRRLKRFALRRASEIAHRRRRVDVQVPR